MEQKTTDFASWIDSQPKIFGDSWISSLGDRKMEEAEFHDADREARKDQDPESTPNRRFYAAADIVKNDIHRWIAENVRDAVFLDYACGNGKLTMEAARAGAALAVGIDLSEVSVLGATEQAAEEGLGATTRFLQRDCEATGLPDSSFDFCLCSGMLHHLDLSIAYPELWRIMRPGGRILCVEALAYNPVIQAYRKRTPRLRTAYETDHILGFREVRLAEKWFKIENVHYYLMVAPLATLLPNGWVQDFGLSIGHAIDRLTTRIPGLRLWSWMFSFELRKPTKQGTWL